MGFVFYPGAGYGRLVGECMATWFPVGFRTGAVVSPVLPGGYAVVGKLKILLLTSTFFYLFYRYCMSFFVNFTVTSINMLAYK